LVIWVLSLSTTKLIPRSLTPENMIYGIRSLIGFGNTCVPLDHSVLYLHFTFSRLALKLFRGEPAISGFDWLFTPTHRSSHSFSALLGSSLHFILLKLHSAHG